MSAAANKPASTVSKNEGGTSNIFPLIVIPATLVVAILFYKFFLGAPSNFIGNDPLNGPKDGNVWGIIYKGGYIVPILITQLLLVIIFSIERFLTIAKAKGAGSSDKFLRTIQQSLTNSDINGAKNLCDKQKGSLANIVRSGLDKYQEMATDTHLVKDQKLLAIQKEVEESTTLEIPMLQRNLPIIATLASIATLFGLLGTVLGMIRSFAAMSNEGAPDATELATGISEALINTALGIGTSAIAIIMYNYFSNSIDELTYRIDEAGYSLQQSFASKY